MKNRNKSRRLLKRVISGVSALALSMGLLTSIPASADDSAALYKYTLFAYSSEEGAISSSAENFCVNGNVATNGTISAGQNFNVNGEKKEHAKETMPYISNSINEKFFAENVETKAENYKDEDVNINVESPLDVKGKAELNGNIKLAAGVKAMGDIVLSGGVLNNDNTVLFSEKGNIVINSENVSLTGLIYAPKGNIVIESKSLNLNSVVMIANKITLNSSNININNSASMAKFVLEAIDKNGSSGGNEDPEPVTDRVIYAYGEYNEETKSVDIEWYSNVTGEFAVLESLNGTDYTVVSKVSDVTKYSIKVTSDFIKKYFKVSTIKDGKTIESIPFSIVNANGKYSTELLDTDKDGLADLYEEMLGTDKTVIDTDKDGLTDYEEVYITNTDPTKYDSVTAGVSDADADNDKDGLNNKKEIELKTDPNSDDTDGDTLKDGDEVNKYNTDPLKKDTDGDDLEDDDEFKFNCDPNKKDTDNNGIIDGKEKHQQTLDVVPDNKEQPITKVNISMAASGNIEKTTTVESIMDKDVMCSNVVGLVGEPFSIESKSNFDKASITFTVDKAKLGDTKFDNLMFLWYDEDNDRFVELETYHDIASSTVSTTTTHFSKYMIVDSYAWFKNWRTILSEQNKKYIENFKPCVTAICVDCSGSMSYNDPVYDTTNKTKRYDAINSFQQAMLWKDYVSIITYESKTKEVSYFSDYFHLISSEELKKSIYSSGGTYVGPALNKAMSQFDSFNQTNPDMDIEKYILLLSDGEFSLQDSILDEVKNKGIVINAVALGKYADKNMLKHCADKTGGEFYEAMTSDDLTDIYRKISKFTHKTSTSNTVSFEDNDIDGLPDELEKTGFVLSNGTVITTDPTKPDTDGDGLPDGQEIDPVPFIYNFNPSSLNSLLKPNSNFLGMNNADDIPDISGYCFNMRSNPRLKDTDYDGVSDINDKDNNSTHFSGILDKNHDGNSVKSQVEYSFCLKDFFKNKLNYNSDLSTFSVLMSAVAYEKSYIIENGNETQKSAAVMLKHHGFDEKDIRVYKLDKGVYKLNIIDNEDKDEDFSFKEYPGDVDKNKDDLDHHISEVCIGHQEVTYNGQTKDIVAVIVRGTNGTITEWTSNMDIGSTEERDLYLEYEKTGDTSKFDYRLNYLYENNRNEFNSYEDWKTEANHKGFDIATNRILRFVKAYTDRFVKCKNITYWITGHSRGGAIANLLSAYLVDDNKEVYAYTFAAPNTTTNTHCYDNKYNCIFNIINKEDFVPTLPCEKWGFNKFGKTKEQSVGNYKYEWETMMAGNDPMIFFDPIFGGIIDCIGIFYKYDSSLDNTVEKIAEIAEDRNECYTKRTRSGSLPIDFFMTIAGVMSNRTMGYVAFITDALEPIDEIGTASRRIAIAKIKGELGFPHFLQSYYLLTKHFS